MKKETKQILISLSLAGAVGCYLYNKIMKAGLVEKVESCPCEQKKPQCYQKTEVVKPVDKVEVVETIKDVEPVELETVETVKAVDEQVIESVDNDIALDIDEITDSNTIETEDDIESDVEIDKIEIPEVTGNVRTCESCGAANAIEDDICQYCGNIINNVDNETQDDTSNDETEEVDENDSSVTDSVLDKDVYEDNQVETVEDESIEPSNTINVNELMDLDKSEPIVETPAEKKDVVMDNVEPLHRVDNQDESAKKEYTSILDFFESL